MASDNSLIPGAEHSIPVEKAKAMTKLYRELRDTILVPELRGLNVLSICETFNREAFDRILVQPACVGVRVYFGMSPEKKVRVIVVGVDKNNKDLIPSSTTTFTSSTQSARTESVDPPPPPPPTEEGVPCPDYCPDPPL